MLNLVTKAITSLFGTKSERDVKELLPYVDRVNAVFATLNTISDEELRARSARLKALLRERLHSFDEQIASLKQKAASFDADIAVKEAAFQEIEKLEKERNKELEVELLAILPEAFAIVKETARRWKENKEMVVFATDWDREVAQNRSGVRIEGEHAIWENTWTAAGNPISWDMMHYDVQLIGGVVLHQGKISEMATGEGKTLVATLPAFLNALAGLGVHIVTVNDYLAKRDSEWMGPLFEFHGLRVDCIDKHQPNSDERRKAYLADITYGTNNEFGFDYLRDNMAREPEELVQRKLHYAMVDEVDSVLIDDARTPLIISGPMTRNDFQQEFEGLKPRIAKMVEAQKQIVTSHLTEAKKLISAGNEKEGGLALFRAHRGMPKYRPLIKYLSETGIKAIMQKTENSFLEDNSRRMPEADKPLLFVINERQNSIDLTESGIKFLTQANEDANFFLLPELSTTLAKIEKNTQLSNDDKLARKDAVLNDYREKANRIHTVQQLLKAYTLFEKEVDYIIQEGKVKIVDEQTGRIMEGRRYSDGLHQAIEAKENVKIEDATQTYATVTLQNYFRMYHKLSGMTGTAETEAGEFWQIYKLDVVVIPTNRPISRKDSADKVYKTVREKYNAVVQEVEQLVAQGRPVLVGTTSVENSELLSRMLRLRNIKHNVLNAKYHQKEAEIVAEAGISGTVTIATNMAGRGTDIKLSPESKAAGGLAIIGTERHESRRVDRQLRGRAGRQGDPGSSQFFVSLEDSLMRLFGSDRLIKLMDRMGGMEEGEVIQHSMITSSIERAQKKVEENNFGTRKRLLEYDDVMNSQREVIYKRRRNALFGERLELDVMNMVFDVCHSVVSETKPVSYEEFELQVVHHFGTPTRSIDADIFRSKKLDELALLLYNEMYALYKKKTADIAEGAVPVLEQIGSMPENPIEDILVQATDFKRTMQVVVNLEQAIDEKGITIPRTIEKFSILNFIDQAWKEQLREMDDLKQNVQNAAYEQKDPLLIYKFSALDLFKRMVDEVNKDVVSFLFKYLIPQGEAPQQAPTVIETDEPLLFESGPNMQEDGQQLMEPMEEVKPLVKHQPIRKEVDINRNDKVTVRYFNTGEVRHNVKYKTVEDDVQRGLCEIVNLA